MREEAAEITRFPEEAGRWRIESWEIGKQTVRADYQSYGDTGRAWLSLFICEPDEQRPERFVTQENLLAGLRAAHPDLLPRVQGTFTYRSQRFHYICYRLPAKNGEQGGCIAGTLLPRVAGKFRVLLVDAESPESTADPQSLLEPLLADVIPAP